MPGRLVVSTRRNRRIPLQNEPMRPIGGARSLPSGSAAPPAVAAQLTTRSAPSPNRKPSYLGFRPHFSKPLCAAKVCRRIRLSPPPLAAQATHWRLNHSFPKRNQHCVRNRLDISSGPAGLLQDLFYLATDEQCEQHCRLRLKYILPTDI